MTDTTDRGVPGLRCRARHALAFGRLWQARHHTTAHRPREARVHVE